MIYMKKIVSFMLVLITLFAFSVNVMATDVDFVPSITNKGAPQLVITRGSDGKNIAGYLYDNNGNLVSTEKDDCMVITSIFDLDKSKDIPKDAKDLLLNVYEQLNQQDAKLTVLCPELNDIVKDQLGDSYTADDLVIRDLFDISGMCDELQKELVKDGYTLELKFDLNIASNSFVTAMVYVDGKWQPLKKVVNNGDGTITCTFENLGPVAFLVKGGDNAIQTVNPNGSTNANGNGSTGANGTLATGDSLLNSAGLWSAILVVSASLIVMQLVSFKKRRNA